MAPAREDVAIGIEPVTIMAPVVRRFETPRRAWSGPCAKPPDPATQLPPDRTVARRELSYRWLYSKFIEE